MTSASAYLKFKKYNDLGGYHPDYDLEITKTYKYGTEGVVEGIATGFTIVEFCYVGCVDCIVNSSVEQITRVVSEPVIYPPDVDDPYYVPDPFSGQSPNDFEVVSYITKIPCGIDLNGIGWCVSIGKICEITGNLEYIEEYIPISINNTFKGNRVIDRGIKFVDLFRVKADSIELITRTYGEYKNNDFISLDFNRHKNDYDNLSQCTDLKQIAISLLPLYFSEYRGSDFLTQYFYQPFEQDLAIADVIDKNFQRLSRIIIASASTTIAQQPLNRRGSIPQYLTSYIEPEHLYGLDADQSLLNNSIYPIDPNCVDTECIKEGTRLRHCSREVDNTAIGWLIISYLVRAKTIGYENFKYSKEVKILGQYLVKQIDPQEGRVYKGWTETTELKDSEPIKQYWLTTNVISVVALLKLFDFTQDYLYLDKASILHNNLNKDFLNKKSFDFYARFNAFDYNTLIYILIYAKFLKRKDWLQMVKETFSINQNFARDEAFFTDNSFRNWTWLNAANYSLDLNETIVYNFLLAQILETDVELEQILNLLKNRDNEKFITYYSYTSQLHEFNLWNEANFIDLPLAEFESHLFSQKLNSARVSTFIPRDYNWLNHSNDLLEKSVGKTIAFIPNVKVENNLIPRLPRETASNYEEAVFTFYQLKTEAEILNWLSNRYGIKFKYINEYSSILNFNSNQMYFNSLSRGINTNTIQVNISYHKPLTKYCLNMDRIVKVNIYNLVPTRLDLDFAQSEAIALSKLINTSLITCDESAFNYQDSQGRTLILQTEKDINGCLEINREQITVEIEEEQTNLPLYSESRFIGYVKPPLIDFGFETGDLKNFEYFYSRQFSLVPEADREYLSANPDYFRENYTYLLSDSTYAYYRTIAGQVFADLDGALFFTGNGVFYLIPKEKNVYSSFAINVDRDAVILHPKTLDNMPTTSDGQLYNVQPMQIFSVKNEETGALEVILMGNEALGYLPEYRDNLEAYSELVCARFQITPTFKLIEYKKSFDLDLNRGKLFYTEFDGVLYISTWGLHNGVDSINSRLYSYDLNDNTLQKISETRSEFGSFILNIKGQFYRIDNLAQFQSKVGLINSSSFFATLIGAINFDSNVLGVWHYPEINEIWIQHQNSKGATFLNRYDEAFNLLHNFSSISTYSTKLNMYYKPALALNNKFLITGTHAINLETNEVTAFTQCPYGYIESRATYEDSNYIHHPATSNNNVFRFAIDSESQGNLMITSLFQFNEVCDIRLFLD